MDALQRKKESLFDHIGENIHETKNLSGKIFKSATDQGVILNGGKNGSRFSPQVLLNLLKKMNKPEKDYHGKFQEIHISDYQSEKINFIHAQKIYVDKMSNSLNEFLPKKIIHIGGGHDHIYPFAKALSEKFENIYILNIDAHADTRIDTSPHSGTPFRQLQDEVKNLKIHQYGILKSANSYSTLSNLDKQFSWTMREEITDEFLIPHSLNSFIQKISMNDCLIISLDCDGLDIKSVSAPNSFGLSLSHIQFLLRELSKISNHVFMGIYEYNPVYDDVLVSDGKKIAGLIYTYLLK